MKKITLWLFFQAISFQIIWLFCVFGRYEWLAIPCVILLVDYFLSPCFKADIMVLPLVVLGFVIDMIFTQMGLFVFDSWPWWLMVLWLAFVLNFGHSLGFLQRLKWHWLMPIGALGGSYAYFVSWHFGSVVWPAGPFLTTAIIAITWAFLLPLLVKGDTFIRQKAYQ